MKIYKFGGSSIHNSDHIKNLGNIVLQHKNEPLIIVASAIDKTTNHLERLLDEYYNHRDIKPNFLKIRNFHLNLIRDLFAGNSRTVLKEVENLFEELNNF